MNLRPFQPISHRPQRQRTPSSHCGEGDAPERSKPQPSNLLRLRSRRIQPAMTIGRLRHIFKPTLLQQKSKKASSRSASRVGIAIKATSSSSHRSRVWSAAEAPLTPTIFGSPSRARWDARSATSSRSRCAGPITATIIALVTRPPGGAGKPSIPSGRRGSSGFQRVVSNEGDRQRTPIRPSHSPVH
jgi:hypothetical protein